MTYSLQWRLTVNTPALSRWEAGDYRLDGAGQLTGEGGSLRRTWTLLYRGTVIGQPSRLSQGKRDADYHRGVSPGHPGSVPGASVDDTPLTPGQVHTANKQRAQQALAHTPAPLNQCTHAVGCPVHPDRQGLHDFTPTAVEALRAVLVQVRWLPITEVTLREIVVSLGLDFADVERGLETPPEPGSETPAYNLDPYRVGKTWVGHGRPAAAIWWGFVVPDPALEGRVTGERLGSACTLGMDGGAVAVTFPDGRKLRFGILRTFRLGVI